MLASALSSLQNQQVKPVHYNNTTSNYIIALYTELYSVAIFYPIVEPSVISGSHGDRAATTAATAANRQKQSTIRKTHSSN